MKFQFVSTPGVGCQDGTFMIKIILHLRHNHNTPTWVVFADLVKDFDTYNHALIISILVKYGASPRIWSVIKHMYYKSVVKIIIGNIETSNNFKEEIKQGDSIAPVLFMFLMISVSKTLKDKWNALGLIKS